MEKTIQEAVAKEMASLKNSLLTYVTPVPNGKKFKTQNKILSLRILGKVWSLRGTNIITIAI